MQFNELTFSSSQSFPLAHSSFPSGPGLRTCSFVDLLICGPVSQPGRPSPRAMAFLQSQVCKGAPWLWRSPSEHDIFFISFWEFWAFSSGVLTSQRDFYGSIVNIFQYWLWSLGERELQDIMSILCSFKNHFMSDRKVTYIWEWHWSVFCQARHTVLKGNHPQSGIHTYLCR